MHMRKEIIPSINNPNMWNDFKIVPDHYEL
jgi:hypothetical protein